MNQPLSLIQAWHRTIADVLARGDQSDAELVELRNATVTFRVDESVLPQLTEHQLAETVEEMRKVFFTTEPNRFGHSYRTFWHGPAGRSDLSDIVELLRAEPASKRALLALVDPTHRKVPCLNALHFLLRHGRLEVTYFARGQDVFLKFCADALCVAEFGERVARELGVELGAITGTISSAHIYRRDLSRASAIINSTSPRP